MVGQVGQQNPEPAHCCTPERQQSRPVPIDAKSDFASIEHIVEGWGGLGHEQSGLKVLVSRGHESRVGVHTRLVHFSVEMYGAWRSGSAWTERVPRRDTKDKRARVQAFCVHIGVHGMEDGIPPKG